MRLTCLLSRAGRTCTALAASCSGAAAIEFAVLVPVILSLAMAGTELANYAMVQMEVKQIATSLADNASRLGQSQNTSVTPTITETDVNSVLLGATTQGGSLNLATNGRVILSSLELDATSGKQWIHWQRCNGNLAKVSAHGKQGAGLTGAALRGVGNGAGLVTAPSGSAVMDAEVFYNYQSLFGNYFIGNATIHAEAAFLNRDNRSLGTTATSGLSPTGTASTC